MEACILQPRLDEVRSLILTLQSNPVVPIKALRKFTGKVQAIASLMYT